MATLISSYNSGGCTGKCDAKCYNALQPKCTCICKGKNHGVGLEQALKNTSELADEWEKEWKESHQGEEVRINQVFDNNLFPL